MNNRSTIILFLGIFLVIFTATAKTSNDESIYENTTTASSYSKDTTYYQDKTTVLPQHLDTETVDTKKITEQAKPGSSETMSLVEMLWYILKMTSMFGSFICGIMLCHRSMKEKGQGKTTGIFFGLLGFVVLAIVLIGSTFPSFAEYEYFPNICWATIFAILLVCTIISHRRNPNWPSMFIEEQNNDHNDRHPKDTRTR